MDVCGFSSEEMLWEMQNQKQLLCNGKMKIRI
jgi:hypothetical protein